MSFVGCFEARVRSQRRKRERARSDEERRLRALEARVLV
jgi:hypothetical protein